jgi:hypothetical protein
MRRGGEGFYIAVAAGPGAVSASFASGRLPCGDWHKSLAHLRPPLVNALERHFPGVSAAFFILYNIAQIFLYFVKR